MWRPNLNKIPDMQLPSGFSLRSFNSGDEEQWVNIINDSYDRHYSVSDFNAIMIDTPSYRPERILFVCDQSGLPCATASAYRKIGLPDTVGMVHYVGRLRDFSGRKLGLSVTIAAIHQFKKEGCSSCILSTDDFRIPAIKLYLDLGFKPLIVHVNQAKRWSDIFDLLKLTNIT
jgi:mycothiol synthase